MKLAGFIPFFAALWLSIVHAGIKTERNYLEITTSEGAEVLIGYSFESFGGNEISGKDVHIEEVLLNANGLIEEKKKKTSINVYFDSTPLALNCDGQICHLKATPKSFRSSLFSKNIYLERSERSKKDSKILKRAGLRAAFKMLDGSWLTNIDGEEYFNLTHNFSNQLSHKVKDILN